MFVLVVLLLVDQSMCTIVIPKCMFGHCVGENIVWAWAKDRDTNGNFTPIFHPYRGS